MGNICCPPKSPCATAEEKSVLLRDESKVASSCGKVGGGACNPEGDNFGRSDEEEGKETLVQHLSENGSNNTQENGPLRSKTVEEAAPIPTKTSENCTSAQGNELKDTPPNGSEAEELKCTLNSQEKEPCADTNEMEEKQMDAAPVQNNTLDTSLKAAVERCPEILLLPEQTTTIHTKASATLVQDDKESSKDANCAAAKPSEEFTAREEVSSVPSSKVATAIGQSSPVAAAELEITIETLSSTQTGDSNPTCSSPCVEDCTEVKTGHNVAQISCDLGDRELLSACSDKEPESMTPADVKDSLESDQEIQPECPIAAGEAEGPSSEKLKQDAGEETTLEVPDKDVAVAAVNNDIEEEEREDEKTPAEMESLRAEIQEESSMQELLEESPCTKNEDGARSDNESALSGSEEDLYRGAEELRSSPPNTPGLSSDVEILKSEDRCSLSPPMDVLLYSEREWKGNTAKSALIRKGYKEMSQKFSGVRRVRGDNYCALRATLFQVLSQSTQLPAWLQEHHLTTLLEKLQAQDDLISQWRFPEDFTGDAAQQLNGYLELLRRTWRSAVECGSPAERQQLCERLFQCGDEELGLLEALKLLMLARAVELHGRMQQGGEDVPLFCWLLFARDSSDCPRSFLSNHLRHVGLSAGLEQVEMFLLGYALHFTIQVYRLYKADTEEFVTYYPDDHKDEWQSVHLVTEDDRHYNVPVWEVPEAREEPGCS